MSQKTKSEPQIQKTESATSYVGIYLQHRNIASF